MTYYAKPKFRFYPREIVDIIIALGVLILSLSILMGSYSHFVSMLPLSALAVLTGFFLHEMAHKYMAFKYGFPAAFKAWYLGLGIALASAFVGFLFAAPGAVMVYGYPSKRENGIISAAGPTTNIVLGFILIGMLPFVPYNSGVVFWYVAYFNFFLAFFNLLPIPQMDGLKVIHWNSGIYAILMILSIVGIVLSYIL